MNYPSWCCQRCGAEIGWIGRALQFVGVDLHRCEIRPAQIIKVLRPVRHTMLRGFSDEEAEKIMWEAAVASSAASRQPGKHWIDAAEAVLRRYQAQRNTIATG